MPHKGADGIANSEDPDQTAPRSGSALFAQTYLSENLGLIITVYWIIVLIFSQETLENSRIVDICTFIQHGTTCRKSMQIRAPGHVTLVVTLIYSL